MNFNGLYLHILNSFPYLEGRNLSFQYLPQDLGFSLVISYGLSRSIGRTTTRQTYFMELYCIIFTFISSWCLYDREQ